MGNSARSQMAEGLFNQSAPPGWWADSAGTEPAERVKPEAISVMREMGIDISTHRPKHLQDALGPDVALDVALVVGLCAEEACPLVPGTRSEHWPLQDPAGSTDPDAYRQTRDELATRIADLVARLSVKGASGRPPLATA